MEDCGQWVRHSHSHLLGGKFKNAPCVVIPRVLRDETELDRAQQSPHSSSPALAFPPSPFYSFQLSPFWCRSITSLNRLRAHKPTLGICIWGGIRAQTKENFQMTVALCSWHSVAPSFQQQDRLWSCHHSKPSLLLRVICQVQSPASASVSSVWSSLQETRNRHVQGKEAHEGKRTCLPSPLHGQLHQH